MLQSVPVLFQRFTNVAGDSLRHGCDIEQRGSAGGSAADRATKWVSIASRRQTRIEAGHETPSPRHLSPASFLARVGIRIDQVPGLRFDRPHDRLDLAVAELIEIVRLHVLELRPDLARLRPLAILGK